MEILKIQNLSKSYKTKVETIDVLKDVNLAINRGDLISIKGKSGSGKSTLLNILGFLDTEYEGKIDIQTKEKDIDKIRAKTIGFVFQFHYLLPEFTALENVCLPALALKEESKEKIYERAKECLKLVDLEDRMNFFPSELSGGQKQRVAIARAMINNPDIILADEPTGNLDEQNSENINKLFKKINEKGQTIVLVTHSSELASIANRKYVIEKFNLKQV